MHRHFSDTAYTPLKPSRLNPNPALNPHPNLDLNLQPPLTPGSSGGTGLGVGAIAGINASSISNSVLAMRPSRGLPLGLMQRGTVSMPTSPVLKRMQVDVVVNVPGLNGDIDLLGTPHPPALSISPTTPDTAADPFGLATGAASPGMEFPGHAPLWHAPQTAQAFYHPPSQNGMDALHSALPPANASPFDISPPLNTAPLGPHGPHWFGSPPLMNHKAYEPAQVQTAGGIVGHEDNRSNFGGGGFVSPFDLSPTKQGTQVSKTEKTTEQAGGDLFVDAYDREAPDMDLDPIQDEAQQNVRGSDLGTGAQDIDMDMGMGMGLGPGGRRKRIQVRIACTHCQKACKKCSNTRPCERCVKYGLPDCVDSSRKPRKTGVKRGPYKRRSSRYEHPAAPSSFSSSSSSFSPAAAAAGSSYAVPHPPPNTTQSSFSNATPNVHRGPDADSFTGAQYTHVQAPAHAHAQTQAQTQAHDLNHLHSNVHAHAHAQHQHQHQVNTHHTRASIPHTHMSRLKTHYKAQAQTIGAHTDASMPRHGKIIGPDRRRSSTTARGKDVLYGGAHGNSNGNGNARSHNRSSVVSTTNENLSDSILHHHNYDSTSDRPMAHAHQIDSYPPFLRQQATGITNTTSTSSEGYPPTTASLSLRFTQDEDQSKQDANVHLTPPHPSAENTRTSNPNSDGGMQAQQANMTESMSVSMLSDPQSVLAQALSDALSVPQTTWINGQRQPIPLTSPPGTSNDNSIPDPVHQQPQSGSAGFGADARGVEVTMPLPQSQYRQRQQPQRPSPLYPRTPVGRFPFSLGGGVADPFSRAVSPIKGISSTSTSTTTAAIKALPQMADPAPAPGSMSGRDAEFNFNDVNGIANLTAAAAGVTQGDGVGDGAASTTGPGNSFWHNNMTKLAEVAEEYKPVSPAMSAVPVGTAIAGANVSAATVGKPDGANTRRTSGSADSLDMHTSIVTGSAHTQDTTTATATATATTPVPATSAPTQPNPESSSIPSSSSSSNPTFYSSLPFPLPRKIRKPSLRTLISSSSSTNTSRAPSPSPISGSGPGPGGEPTPAMAMDTDSNHFAHPQSRTYANANANSKPMPVSMTLPMQLQMTSSSYSSPAPRAGHGQNAMKESGVDSASTSTATTALGLATSARYPPPRRLPANVNNVNNANVDVNSGPDADPFGLGLGMGMGVGPGPTLDLSLANIHVHGLRQDSNLSRDASSIHGPGPGDQSPMLFSGPMSLDD